MIIEEEDIIAFESEGREGLKKRHPNLSPTNIDRMVQEIERILKERKRKRQIETLERLRDELDAIEANRESEGEDDKEKE